MSLIDETKKLRELEQKAQDAPDWPSPVEEVVYTDALLQHAPAMLEVLGMIREGDADTLDELLSDWVYSEQHPAVEVLNRLQKMAALMGNDEATDVSLMRRPLALCAEM